MAKGLHITINPESITTIAGVTVTDSMLAGLLVSGLIILAAVVINRSLKQTTRPTGWQGLLETIIESLKNLFDSVTLNSAKTKQFFPLLAGFFIFIIMNNWFGLLPFVSSFGYLRPVESHAQQSVIYDSTLPAKNTISDTESVETLATNHKAKTEFIPYLRPTTADLNMTLALGLISVAATQYFGVKQLGLAYFKKFINFSSPIMFFVGLLELISELAKILSFGFRLFGNIFAGKVLLLVIKFLVPLVIPMPFYILELFIGFIQALVFTMLSLVFFNMATESHDDH